MKNYQLKKSMVLFLAIGFCIAGFLPIINGSNLSQKQNNNLFIRLEDAKKVAENKIYSSKSTEYYIVDSIQIKNQDDSTIMYIFLLNPQGYIVVPSNKKLPPIIAYSFENEFGEICQENVLLKLLKADISSRIENINLISENIIKERNEKWQEYFKTVKINQQSLASIVGPLLDTKWSQNEPYNNFCPLDLKNGGRCVAGCPAVAIAQILNYHRTTQDIEFSDEDDYYHNYGGNRYTIDNDYQKYDFTSFPQLNAYLDTLEYNYENDIDLTDNNKAAITFACGIAAKQVYTFEVSGTFGVNQAFDAYQRFGFDDIKLLTDEPDVYDQLQSNILEGFPVHIAVVNEGWNSGHNMVVDGYDDEGYFHINFGWGGSYDGWYMLPEEIPYELTVLEGIIIDIKPNSQNGHLEGSGVLNWADVSAGSTVTGNFTIQNIGNTGSSIDWEITIWPDWGTWTFTPDSGEDLTPEDGKLTINVEVIAPNKKNKEFAGYVKVVNTQNSSDYCLIHISLTTPKSTRTNNLAIRVLGQYPNLFGLLKNIFRLKL